MTVLALRSTVCSSTALLGIVGGKISCMFGNSLAGDLDRVYFVLHQAGGALEVKDAGILEVEIGWLVHPWHDREEALRVEVVAGS